MSSLDITNQRLLRLCDAAALLPKRRGGRPVHVSTLYRWATRALRDVRLSRAKAPFLAATNSTCVSVGTGAVLRSVSVHDYRCTFPVPAIDRPSVGVFPAGDNIVVAAVAAPIPAALAALQHSRLGLAETVSPETERVAMRRGGPLSSPTELRASFSGPLPDLVIPTLQKGISNGSHPRPVSGRASQWSPASLLFSLEWSRSCAEADRVQTPAGHVELRVPHIRRPAHDRMG